MSTASAHASSRAPASDGAARGKVVVITGASSGLGLETAKHLAHEGAEIVMVCRDRSRGAQASTMVGEVATGRPPVLTLADLSVQADIRRVTQEIKDRYDQIDVLINNAGGASASRELTEDGIERTWAARTNFGGGGPSGVIGLVTSMMKRTPVFRRADQAAEGIVWAATAPELSGASGQLYMRHKQLKLKGAAADPELAERLWQISAEQVRIDPVRASAVNGTSGSETNG